MKDYPEFGKNILSSFSTCNHFPCRKYMVNKPKAAAIRQRSQISAESARSKDNRTAGCFKLRVGSMGDKAAFTRDCVKAIT